MYETCILSASSPYWLSLGCDANLNASDQDSHEMIEAIFGLEI
jgi:hypothetical protein